MLDKQMVDNKIVVQIGTEAIYELYKIKLNNFSILKWTFRSLTKELNFLDFTLTIKKTILILKTMRKR